MFIVLCFGVFPIFSISIADTYVYAPSYDIPAAFAFLSLTPTLVMFVVKVETAFFEKYRSLFYLINHNASYNDIAYSKEEVLNVTNKRSTIYDGNSIVLLNYIHCVGLYLLT